MVEEAVVRPCRNLSSCFVETDGRVSKAPTRIVARVAAAYFAGAGAVVAAAVVEGAIGAGTGRQLRFLCNVEWVYPS